jgi:hypothetical protein
MYTPSAMMGHKTTCRIFAIPYIATASTLPYPLKNNTRKDMRAFQVH